MPKNYIKNIREYIFNVVKDSIERKIYLNPNIVANVEEISIVLERIIGVTIENGDKKLLKFIPLVKLIREYIVFYAFSEM